MFALVFYKGDGNWFDSITRWRTNGEFSHVEILFSDGVSFSASQWDGGTRFKRIDYDPSKWDLVPLQGISEEVVRRWCASASGRKYDWRGVLGIFAGKHNPGEKEKWFCSEVCASAIQTQGILKHLVPSETSPQALWIAAKARFEAINQ